MPKRLVDQVGEHGAQCGERQPPVTDKTCQHKADEDAGHDVGEEIHRHPVAEQPYTLFPRAEEGDAAQIGTAMSIIDA